MMKVESSRLALLSASGVFDADWYRRTYPDVDMVRMDPAEHYLTYGHLMGRDPGPDFCTQFARLVYLIGQSQEPVTRLAEMAERGGPREPRRDHVLYAAGEAARLHGYERGIRLAEAYLPTDLAYTSSALRANASVAAGDSTGWCAHFNAYLGRFGIAPILLQGEGSVFDRLGCAQLAPVAGGPLVSVIMPAWNAAATLRKSAGSILAQTWRNIELLIVDDASTDETWTILQEIAAQDKRVRILRNKVNVGPYVSKNLALLEAKGEWITGHDADDWAHPQRIERHLAEANATGTDVSLAYMVRVTPEGKCTQIRPVSELSFDGVARVCFISCLFRAETLRRELGFWDSVRFAADSEMIDRAALVLGERFATFRQIGMISLDIPTSLTNHPEFGARTTGLSPVRRDYARCYADWHERALRPETAFLSFPQSERRFAAPQEMVVPPNVIACNLVGRKGIMTPQDW